MLKVFDVLIEVSFIRSSLFCAVARTVLSHGRSSYYMFNSSVQSHMFTVLTLPLEESKSLNAFSIITLRRDIDFPLKKQKPVIYTLRELNIVDSQHTM